MSVPSLRIARSDLLEQADLQGTQFCRTLSDVTDRWLADVADQAAGRFADDVVLLAVGGYGRRELCPFSDLDLLLVHNARRSVGDFADDLWYPIWDEGLSVDHAVRTPKEVVALAKRDLRVALGLLDARVIWGDSSLAQPLLENVAELWDAELVHQFLPDLEEQMAQRHSAEGDVAFLLEPNLKESHGGLRDANVLRSLSSTSPTLHQLVDFSAVEQATSMLVSVRVELHRLARREQDRFLLQDQDAVASLLGYRDADALCRAVSEAGRTIALVSDETWRRQDRWGSQRSEHVAPSISLEADLALEAGEITLTSDADLHDQSLIWRFAACGAENDTPLSLASLHALSESVPLEPTQWTDRTLQSFLRLMFSGATAVSAFEALDRHGLIVATLPEWEHVRYFHQRNAYHRFTVDRHLLETAANAAALVGTVDRPDLLITGALFHDIGKGLPGDHTELGITLVGAIAPRLGFGAEDVSSLQLLVRHHLLLADTATRRDLADPRTIEMVAEAVKTISMLRLLAALTKADSIATGSSAWSPWKEQLIDELVERTAAHLDGVAPEGQEQLSSAFSHLVDDARRTNSPRFVLDPPRIVVAMEDRPGLLSSLAGTLAILRLDVLTADADSVDGFALDSFTVQALNDRWPDERTLAATLSEVLDQGIDIAARLEQQASNYSVGQRPWSARPSAPFVRLDNEASTDATVVEVRAADRIGLLYQLTAALFSHNLDVIAARVATIGGDVVDSFYVCAQGGGKVLDLERHEVIADSLFRILKPDPRVT